MVITRSDDRNDIWNALRGKEESLRQYYSTDWSSFENFHQAQE